MTTDTPPGNRALPARDASEEALDGILEDGDGRPVQSASVSVSGTAEPAVTAADGSFRLRGAARDPTATIQVQDRGRSWRLALPGDGGSRVRVVITPPDAVPLRVLTPGTAPVPARFGWTALRRGPEGLRESASGDASAPRFLARGFEPGSYAVLVWGGPFLPAVVEPVVVDGALGPALVTVELTRRGAAVAGRAPAPAGAPRVGAAVVASPVDGSLPVPARRALCRSDAGGRYRIEGLPWGTYLLVVDVGLGTPSETRIALLEREERALDLRA